MAAAEEMIRLASDGERAFFNFQIGFYFIKLRGFFCDSRSESFRRSGRRREIINLLEVWDSFLQERGEWNWRSPSPSHAPWNDFCGIGLDSVSAPNWKELLQVLIPIRKNGKSSEWPLICVWLTNWIPHNGTRDESALHLGSFLLTFPGGLL